MRMPIEIETLHSLSAAEWRRYACHVSVGTKRKTRFGVTIDVYTYIYKLVSLDKSNVLLYINGTERAARGRCYWTIRYCGSAVQRVHGSMYVYSICIERGERRASAHIEADNEWRRLFVKVESFRNLAFSKKIIYRPGDFIDTVLIGALFTTCSRAAADALYITLGKALR